jgi:hypothetical protein
MNDEMVTRFASLFSHERDALVAALRRDAEALFSKMGADSTNAYYYQLNHRLVNRLLEVLAPSTPFVE